MMKLSGFQENFENIKIIECPELSNNIIFKKYNVSEGDIVKVSENQFVCVFEKGRVLDIKENKGTYKFLILKMMNLIVFGKI